MCTRFAVFGRLHQEYEQKSYSSAGMIVIFEVFLRFADISVCSLDNASDPGVCAKKMWIDVVEEKGQLCLTFTDNGCGMTPSKLHKMLR